jgi:hypothetical protein
MKERINFENASKSYSLAVAKKYPVGTIVEVCRGGVYFTAQVTNSGRAWWADPGGMYGINLKTGKKRRFEEAQVVGILSDNDQAQRGRDDEA